jgi:non-specific serine/threonine protein kinase
LFGERARAARADFAVAAADEATVAEICDRLDGLPLAIELAAARMRLLTPSALFARLDQRLPILTGGGRDQPTRLRSVRDAIAWSHDLMSSEERVLFRRLAVFAGGFTLEAAQAVAAVRDEAEIDVLEGISSLVDQSLVQPVARTAGATNAENPRFDMLETIREFGLEQLAASGDEEAIRAAHATHFLGLAETVAPDLAGPEVAALLHFLEHEYPNFRAAFTWLLDHGEGVRSLRLALAVARFWSVRGHHNVARMVLERALAIGDEAPPKLRVEAMIWASWLSTGQGDHSLTERFSAAVLETETDDRIVGTALFLRSLVASDRGDHGEALELAERSLERFRAAGDAPSIAWALNRLGLEVSFAGDLVRAAQLYEEAIASHRARGQVLGLPDILINLGQLAHTQGDRRRAAAHYRETLALCRGLGPPSATAEVLRLVGALAGTAGEWEQAVRLFGAAEVQTTKGARAQAFDRSLVEPVITDARWRLGEETFASAWTAGRRLPMDQAIDEAEAVVVAQATGSASSLALAAAYGLTPREAEILRLIAAGRSNRDIAATLFIERRTVTTHSTRILGKLGVADRTAAAAFAHRHGLD